MSTPFKIIHDESYAESKTGNQYIIVKVYDNDEIGQIKLELVKDDQGASVKIDVSGKVKLYSTPDTKVQSISR